MFHLSLIAAVLLRILCNPTGSVFQKQLILRGNHPLLINFLVYLLLGICSIPLALFLDWPKTTISFWIYAILVGVFGAFGNGFVVKALEKGELSVLGPINAYKSVVGLMIAYLLLNEIPGVQGVLGMVLIIGGSYFVLETVAGGGLLRIIMREDIRYRLLALLLTAIEAVFVKKLMLLSSAAVAAVCWSVFGTLFSMVFINMSGTRAIPALRRLKSQDFGKIALLTLSLGTMLFATTYTLNHMPVGYALSLFQLSAVLSIFMGRTFFQEKGMKRKIFGAVIMICGSMLIVISR
jgi:drug/metabolite transporter (DMT)-like permease